MGGGCCSSAKPVSFLTPRQASRGAVVARRLSTRGIRRLDLAHNAAGTAGTLAGPRCQYRCGGRDCAGRSKVLHARTVRCEDSAFTVLLSSITEPHRYCPTNAPSAIPV